MQPPRLLITRPVRSQSLLNNLVDSARSAAAAKIKGGGAAFDVVPGARGPAVRRPITLVRHLEVCIAIKCCSAVSLQIHNSLGRLSVPA